MAKGRVKEVICCTALISIINHLMCTHVHACTQAGKQTQVPLLLKSSNVSEINACTAIYIMVVGMSGSLHTSLIPRFLCPECRHGCLQRSSPCISGAD